MESKELGRFGEDVATTYLERTGYEILCRNFTCRLGEIDIIASKADDIVFVEVKTRSEDEFGRPAEAVGAKKQANIRKAATVYMLGNERNDQNMRFDVFEVFCNHIESAF